MEFKDLVGMTLTSVKHVDNERIEFEADDGRSFAQMHYQDCCEHVVVEDVSGDLVDLTGSPVLFAEESSNTADSADGSQTWTFYRIGTINGAVVIRWHGSSNGYYSESVSFVETTEAK